MLGHALPAHFHEEQCRDGIQQYHHKDRLNDTGRGVFTNGLRAAGNFETFKTANHGDQKGEYRSFSKTHKEVLEGDVALDDRHKLTDGDVQHQRTHDGAAQHARDHADKRKQWQAEHHGQHSRHNEQFNRVKTKSANGIQLFVDLHGTNLCGKRTGRSPSQQNSGQQNAELPKERKGHQVDGVDGGTEILKNRGAQKRDNGSHQKGQQRDDRQGIQAGVVNGGNERRKAPARRTGKNE